MGGRACVIWELSQLDIDKSTSDTLGTRPACSLAVSHQLFITAKNLEEKWCSGQSLEFYRTCAVPPVRLPFFCLRIFGILFGSWETMNAWKVALSSLLLDSWGFFWKNLTGFSELNLLRGDVNKEMRSMKIRQNKNGYDIMIFELWRFDEFHFKKN